MAALQNLDEESILREIGQHNDLVTKMRYESKKSQVWESPNKDDLLASGDFDVSRSNSPGKLDR